MSNIMQAQSSDRSFESFANPVVEPVTQFQSIFIDCMEMYAEVAAVASYLDEHAEWFRRCAHPMKADPIGQNGYILTIGRYGALGYEIEPKIGLDLLPQEERVYRIETIPVPGFVAPGYDVDFRASMELVECQRTEADPEDYPEAFTRVQWRLDLTVKIQFPKFIQVLPNPIVQGTGDRLLEQIIRQVSRRLTQKVQVDFHSSRDLPMPKSPRRWFFQG